LIVMSRLTVIALICGALTACASHTNTRSASPNVAPLQVPAIARPQGETPEWWFLSGAATAQALRGKRAGQAKNVILFLGDGMSLSTIAAARILEGQRNGRSGEEQRLSFEDFPYSALSRTYEVDAQTADSAGTMSAIMTGVKTRYGVISVNQRALRAQCATTAGNEATSAMEIAAAAGMGTGIVTTTRITHATPAATYGHSSERKWEYDAAMPLEARQAGCTDLAQQFVEFDIGRGIDVMLGGGRSGFLPEGTPDPEYPELSGKRVDGRNLVHEWQQRRPNARYVWNLEQFNAIDTNETGPVLGLFEPEHMRYVHEREGDGAGEPSLAEMTRKAISLLSKNPNGYLLVVEGGRIDHGHHASNAFRALGETIGLSDAVRAAREMTSEKDTLIVVTADHSHVMTFAGYPVRGNPILGKMRGPTLDGGASRELSRDKTGRTFTTLGYANGSGYVGASNLQPEGPKRYPHEPKHFEPAQFGRPDLDAVDTEHPDYLQESTVPMTGETHSGEDVAVFAVGPGAEAVRGSVEQNVLFHLIAQGTPALRRQLCKMDACADGQTPSRLPARQHLLKR
jgi:alkaline phosphatase